MNTRDHFKNKASLKKLSKGMVFKNILQMAVIVLCFTQCSFSRTQEITEGNYLKVDSLIWMQYEQEMGKISECYKNHPEKIDSLKAASDSALTIASKKNTEAAIKYASVPSGLQRLFMVRLNISKDTILSILKTLPDSMQNSHYGKSLLYHIESEQIVEGSKYCDFQAIDTERKNFTLSSLEGKNILLLYGGLGCMGSDGREYLNKIYRETDTHTTFIPLPCQS